MTYREMWDTYVEPNLPPEVEPEDEKATAEASALAAAFIAGVDLTAVRNALKREVR